LFFYYIDIFLIKEAINIPTRNLQKGFKAMAFFSLKQGNIYELFSNREKDLKNIKF